MEQTRRLTLPRISWPIWRYTPEGYLANREAFEERIIASELTAEEIKREMGVGTEMLDQVLAGKPIGGWSVSYLEYALRTPDEKRAAGDRIRRMATSSARPAQQELFSEKTG